MIFSGKKLVYTLAAALMCGCAETFADFSLDGEYPWGKLDESVVSEHRTFFKPAAGKKNRIFFIGYKLGLREIAEFRQRNECDFQYWSTNNAKSFSPFEPKPLTVYAPSMDLDTYRAERARIFGSMKDCNVIVLGKFPFTLIPKDLQKKILDQVKGGTKMVMITIDGAAPSVSGLSFQKMPLPDGFETDNIPLLKGVALYSADLGAGKVVAVVYPKNSTGWHLTENLTPYNSEHKLYYDYYHAFLGKLIQELTGNSTATMKWNNQGLTLNGTIPAGAMIRYDVIDRYGKVLASQKVPAKAGQNQKVQFKNILGSAECLDAFLTDSKGKVLNFATRKYQNELADRINSVTFLSDVADDNRKISGTVQLSRKTGKGTLIFTAFDEYGRMILMDSQKVTSDKHAFNFTFLPYGNLSAELTVDYFLNGKLVDQRKEKIYFKLDPKDVKNDFLFAMWGYATTKSRATMISLQQMKKSGIEVVMDCDVMFFPGSASIAPRQIHDHGMGMSVFLIRLLGDRKYQKHCGLGLADLIRKNNSYFDKDGKPYYYNYHTVDTIVKELSRFNMAFYNLGDENALSMHGKAEVCLCNECAVRFRAYLKNLYGTIEKLNAQYGSKFKDFESIKPLPLDEAADKELLSMWLDFRMFMDSSFTEWHKLIIDHVRKYDKVSPVGIEGMTYPANSYTGFNLSQMLPNFDFCAPYFIRRDIHALKYMKNNSIKSAWYGTYDGRMGEQNMRQTPWKYLFAGLGGAFWWYSGYPGYSNATIFRDDLGLLKQFTQSADEIRKIKDSGIGKLLIDSNLQKCGIAVHYSQACLHASTLNPDKTSWELSINNTGDLIQSLGLDYEYLNPQEILAGKLKDFKVLFMPYSQALSKKEAAAIKEFVRNGGLLIADFTPGIMNEHGKFLDDSLLADVFGSFDKMNIKKYGKGTAVYLDNYIDGISHKIPRGSAVGIQRAMLAVLKKYAGVVPFATALDNKKAIVEYGIFEDGDAKYLTFLGPLTEAGAKQKSTAGAEGNAEQIVVSAANTSRTVTLIEPRHVYDLKTNKYLGYVKTFTFVQQPAVGQVFACLKEKAATPEVSAPKSFERGKIAEFSIQKVPNTCIVTIVDPTGKTVFRKNISKNGTFRFIPALNAPSGKYSVNVRNVIGGAIKTVNLNLK